MESIWRRGRAGRVAGRAFDVQSQLVQQLTRISAKTLSQLIAHRNRMRSVLSTPVFTARPRKADEDRCEVSRRHRALCARGRGRWGVGLLKDKRVRRRRFIAVAFHGGAGHDYPDAHTQWVLVPAVPKIRRFQKL